MSQAKVDRYKKEKADRKKTMRKEKIMRNVKRCVAGVIVLATISIDKAKNNHQNDTDNYSD